MNDMSSEAKGIGGSAAQLKAYNYNHFLMKHLIGDLWRTARAAGIRPGSQAPDFDLESTDGGRVRLSDQRGEIVLLHLGSAT